ncbi:YafY family protein [Nocardioides sp.]|uniref:helix-turn-helix transcriptional regulator n=1 Tax=Nocardioides sp. TaxID=35761 RepID=UPI00263357DE|nr:WYL domain-containing protein [Nocardioides sp.]
MSAPKASYGSKDQIARLLALVPYLHARGEIRLSEAAQMLGVPERQVTKDLKVLWMCGLPGGMPDDLIDVDMEALEGADGDRVIRIQNADYLARPLRLSPTEATALIVALRAMRDGAGEGTREVIDRALGKLEQAAADAAPLVHAGTTTDDEAAAIRQSLERALREGRQVTITYYVPTRDEESERTIDPHQITRAHQAEYVDAWCHLAEAPRWFRLDRIRRVDVLDTPITSASTARTLDGDSETALLGSDGTLATVELAPQAQWITEYYPVEAVRQLGDGRCQADLLVADPQWLVRLALRSAPHVQIVGPQEFTDLFHATVGRIEALYR